MQDNTKLSKIKSYKQDLIMRFNAVDVEFEISINGTGYLGLILIKERKRKEKGNMRNSENSEWGWLSDSLPAPSQLVGRACWHGQGFSIRVKTLMLRFSVRHLVGTCLVSLDCLYYTP